MKILLDVTDSFLYGVDSFFSPANTCLILNYLPEKDSTIYSFDMLNINLTIDENIANQLQKYLPNIYNILNCSDTFNVQFIKGKIDFTVTEVKGIEIATYINSNFSF